MLLGSFQKLLHVFTESYIQFRIYSEFPSRTLSNFFLDPSEFSLQGFHQDFFSQTFLQELDKMYSGSRWCISRYSFRKTSRNFITILSESFQRILFRTSPRIHSGMFARIPSAFFTKKNPYKNSCRNSIRDLIRISFIYL